VLEVSVVRVFPTLSFNILKPEIRIIYKCSQHLTGKPRLLHYKDLSVNAVIVVSYSENRKKPVNKAAFCAQNAAFYTLKAGVLKG
jgi:hypothetical protein